MAAERPELKGGRLTHPLGERGSVVLTAAIILPLLLGFIALGTDTANWYMNNRDIDRIADAAAFAAAPYLADTSKSPAQITAIAMNDAALNGLSTTTGDTIAVSIAADRSLVSVTATRPLTQFFSAMFLPTAPNTSASAQAGPAAYPVCMLIQSPSASGALTVNNGASFSAPGCEIDVASTSPTAGTFNADLTQVGKVCVAGGSVLDYGVQVTNLANNCTAVSDPYSGNIPSPTVGNCVVDGKVYGPGTVNLSPGVYCGNYNWNGPGTVNLAPGLYIFKSGVNWTISEQWTINGAGVTFYFVDSNSYVDFSGGSTVNLSAPTSGTYANILMFEAPGLSPIGPDCTGDGCFNITGSANGNQLTGVIDLPSRNLLLASGVVNATLTVIANTLTFYGTMSWSINAGSTAIPHASDTASATLQ